VETTVLRCPGVTELPEQGLRILCSSAESIVNEENRFTVRPQGQPVVRTRLPGDAMRLPGGTKTLKKLFIDRKIPASQRAAIPVIADETGVLGVYGIGANRDTVPQDLPAVEIRFEAFTEK
jgi:tRNA(Ile)-lysidine synthase